MEFEALAEAILCDVESEHINCCRDKIVAEVSCLLAEYYEKAHGTNFNTQIDDVSYVPYYNNGWTTVCVQDFDLKDYEVNHFLFNSVNELEKPFDKYAISLSNIVCFQRYSFIKINDRINYNNDELAEEICNIVVRHLI